MTGDLVEIITTVASAVNSPSSVDQIESNKIVLNEKTSCTYPRSPNIKQTVFSHIRSNSKINILSADECDGDSSECKLTCYLPMDCTFSYRIISHYIKRFNVALHVPKTISVKTEMVFSNINTFYFSFQKLFKLCSYLCIYVHIYFYLYAYTHIFYSGQKVISLYLFKICTWKNQVYILFIWQVGITVVND